MNDDLKSKKKYELLRDELLDYIEKNGLKKNDHLPTIKEIIKKIGYSYATVNRTLNEMEHEGLITKVQGSGLYVNRIVSKAKTKQVALIIPKNFSDHKIFLDILTGVRGALEKEKIGLIVSISNMSHEHEKETIDRLLTSHVDGCIIFLEDHYRQDYAHIAELKEMKFPFVLVDRFIPEVETDYVVIDNSSAMLKICSYLKYNKQCDKIILVPPPDISSSVSSSLEKKEGFKNAIHMLYGSDDATIMPFDELIVKLNELSIAHKRLGICLNHDAMFIELQKKLRELNVSWPKNCVIFGYNNSYDPPLCPTVEQFNDKVGQKAAEILVRKMENINAAIEQVRIEPKLVLQDSDNNYYMED